MDLVAQEKGDINKMTELDKLENYLKEHEISYERIDSEMLGYRHIIFVPSRVNREWDAICQFGSYGYESGLLEIYGSIVDEKYGDTDDVRGYLTAEDVIHRIEDFEK